MVLATNRDYRKYYGTPSTVAGRREVLQETCFIDRARKEGPPWRFAPPTT